MKQDSVILLLVAALLIAGIGYIAWKNNAFGAFGSQPNDIWGSGIYTPGDKEVVLEFMYASWCPHCAAMKPIIAKLKTELPADRFAVSYLEEKDPLAQAAYAKYKANKYFDGYPTFVLNGNDYKVGEIDEQEFRAWVCSKFNAPKPAACNSAGNSTNASQ